MKFRSVIDLPESSVEFDEYIPVTVRWLTSGRSTPFYYYLYGENGELVEVGLDYETFALCKLNIVSMASLETDVKIFHGAVSRRGLPVLEPDPSWKEPLDFSNRTLPIRFSLWESQLQMSLSGNRVEQGCMVLDAGPARIAINSSNCLVGTSVELPPGDHLSRLRAMVE